MLLVNTFTVLIRCLYVFLEKNISSEPLPIFLVTLFCYGFGFSGPFCRELGCWLSGLAHDVSEFKVTGQIAELGSVDTVNSSYHNLVTLYTWVTDTSY